MDNVWAISGADHQVHLFGIRLVGVSGDNLKKLILTLALLAIIWLLRALAHLLMNRVFAGPPTRGRFWTRQAVRLVTAIVTLTGIISIWFNNPSRLGSAAALVTAGLAVASQRLITAIAGYFIILRGRNFNVGDRIMMGGVRGDVIAVGFMQTTIMEMGEPPGEQSDPPSMWVAGRQYTGRMVTLTNDKIFDEPVYNYTREFPYIWEELRLPIPYNADRRRAEKIILDAVKRHTLKVSEVGEEALTELQRRYMVEPSQMEPSIFLRLTDNWVEMAVRFVAHPHGVRSVKDKISREILDGLDEAKIGIASGTYEVVGMPELRVKMAGDPRTP